MSHQPQRKENNCLNCGAIVQGRYCQNCGQENIETHQNFWQLSRHFVFDIFHFDGKFFDTLKQLLFHPGTISKEYVMGKRQRYLDPIRMYLFTSAVFFLVFFTIRKPDMKVNITGFKHLHAAERMDLAMNVSAQLQQQPQSTTLKSQLALITDSTYRIELLPFAAAASADSVLTYHQKKYVLHATKKSGEPEIKIKSGNSWLVRQFRRKADEFTAKYGDNPDEAATILVSSMLHKLPYLLFVSLPFFAGLLKLLYVRRKQFYYSDHAVFTLHHYILSFILLLLIFSFNKLGNVLDWGIFDFINFALFITWIVYLFVGMQNFYGQRRFKTFGKFVLLNVFGFALMLLLAIIFFSLSIFQL